MDSHSYIEQVITIFTELKYLERTRYLIRLRWFPCGSTIIKAGKIGIWQHWFFKRAESQITRRESSRKETRTNQRVNLHVHTCRTPCPDQMLNKLVGDNRTTPSLLPKFGNIVPLKKTHKSKRWTLLKQAAAVSHYKTFPTQFCMHVFLLLCHNLLNTLSALITTTENN